jgi:hypothetical protein
MMITDLEHILTEKDYEIAAKNGISRRIARMRFNRLFWNKEDCITQPVRKYTESQWRAKCRDLGIVTLSTFDQRVNRLKWDEEKAATTPPLSHEEIADLTRKVNRKYPDWVHDNLKKHNISNKTFHGRIRGKWNMEEACTIPEDIDLVDYYRNRVKELESQLG